MLRNKIIEFDREFLAAPVFPQEGQFKKTESVKFVSPCRGNDADTIDAVANVFAGDRDKLRHFAEQVAPARHRVA